MDTICNSYCIIIPKLVLIKTVFQRGFSLQLDHKAACDFLTQENLSPVDVSLYECFNISGHEDYTTGYVSQNLKPPHQHKSMELCCYVNVLHFVNKTSSLNNNALS